MPRSAAQIRTDALAIWYAAIDAVRSDRLIQKNVRVEGRRLLIGDQTLDLSSIRRIAVVGAGKAGAGMAAGLEEALGPQVMAEKDVRGWINVPADCVRELSRIHLHPARPAGVNEPTSEGVFGAQRILEIVESLGPADLCLCLLSGGASALLPAPVDGVSLEEKQAVTRLLSSGGANIQELNTVRKQLSRIKGGGLARACRAGRLIALIISDVLGDPLDIIASGPTVADSSTPEQAIQILERYGADDFKTPAALATLRRRAAAQTAPPPLRCLITNLIIGNNALAVEAAGKEAHRRGYLPAIHAAHSLEGPAEEVGRDHAQMAIRMQTGPGPDCLITGGEPTVKLAPPEIRGLGGRNQQLVLAALCELLRPSPVAEPAQVPRADAERAASQPPWTGIVLLSGGTDGEDGPTDAAGAVFDPDLVSRMHELGLDPHDFLRRNDAYHFFQPLGGLIYTGPTHTNVCDIRVALVARVQPPVAHRP